MTIEKINETMWKVFDKEMYVGWIMEEPHPDGNYRASYNFRVFTKRYKELTDAEQAVIQAVIDRYETDKRGVEEIHL